MSNIATLNPFFNNSNSAREQRLYEDLVIESVRQYGISSYYMPKRLENYDRIYGQSDVVKYDTAYSLPLYLESVFGFDGEPAVFHNFGLEIRNQIIVALPKRIFDVAVGTTETILRPNEGDLVFFPFQNTCFQIKYTNNKEVFYQFGKLNLYTLTCELFEYANEKFTTGVPEIDRIMDYSTNILDYTLNDEDGNPLVDEKGDYITTEKYNPANTNPIDNTDQIQREANNILDFTEFDPFSGGRY